VQDFLLMDEKNLNNSLKEGELKSKNQKLD